MDDVYYVASHDDGPEIIYFTSEEAFASGYTYIDIFDTDGEKIVTYKLDTDDYTDTSEEDYTTNF
ncbi:hypothetical protein JZU46_06100 [bacterium]|nr:hypothetical protein [bacterium]